jgi:hypothetical protein
LESIDVLDSACKLEFVIKAVGSVPMFRSGGRASISPTSTGKCHQISTRESEAPPEALGLARATLRTIKQNLVWAFFYNAIGVPLAALGFMSPILCAAAMGVSDIVVIGNALRLRGWRLRPTSAG